jgi:LDH2 family malate/lactate/ureidoglycolate dehydrogenase
VGTILDSEGRPTTDPAAFLNGGLMAPLGSPAAPHKGFGLALVIDVLAGVLTGSLFARDLGDDPTATGNLFWALDPEAFMPRAEFLARVDELIGQVKAAGGPSAEEPLLPGERGQQRFEEITRRGTVPLSAAAWGVVEKAALTLEIPLPAAIQK